MYSLLIKNWCELVNPINAYYSKLSWIRTGVITGLLVGVIRAAM